MDKFPGVWKASSSCTGCNKYSFCRKKKTCSYCKINFCQSCIIRRTDKKLCCKKCQILTATPLNKNDLLNLRSRDLVNYLSSKHISTSGCVEKEDLVNALMKAVNEKNSSAADSGTSSAKNSCPSSPGKGSTSNDRDGEGARQSGEASAEDDGIRIIGIDTSEAGDSSSLHSVNSEVLNEGDWVVVNEKVENTPHADEDDSRSNDAALQSTKQEKMECASGNGASSRSEQKEKIPRNVKLSDITCEGDFESMTVTELKTLLMANRTDYKGCVERTELIERAIRLWTDYTVSRRDLEKLSLDELCKICMDAPIECVLLECGHMATCMNCGKQLSECPMCRQYVVRCVRTFKV